MARNYKREYALESRQRKDARAQRNRARRIMMKKGKAHVGDHEDVGHIKAISRGGTNNPKNLEMQNPHANRSFKRNSERAMVSEISTSERKAKGKKK